MLDDFWMANVTYNPNATNASSRLQIEWENLTPTLSIRPPARGIAQTWLQYEHVHDHVNNTWVQFDKTTLYVMGVRIR